MRIPLVLLATAALAGGATAAIADRGNGHADHARGAASERLFTLQPDPAGNPEGIAYDQRSRSFLVSITAGGAIYRGTLDSDAVRPYIAGAAGRAAIGIKTRRGRLYVAGGPTGRTGFSTSTMPAA